MRVIDSSVIIAVLLKETGSEVAIPIVFGGNMSAVIHAEIYMKCAMKGIPFEFAAKLMGNMQIEVFPLSADLAIKAGELKLDKRFWPLSLADCICIALAIEKSATLVTADRAWLDLKLPCPVEVIR